ncbi:gamma-glutamylcyclotransferase [Pontibacterium sp. N1Y112]|uniref:Gamma-glutamylcyclotransferase n=1 Tax=Pontibacterium sinense TaxID=2781979 RepID=A0A8J7FML4_9GAMM|nr:gamma-glutamylcyclotransferase family protein [Pontibacterium sinense]MBE9397242.1 gamma-glutamylcyclotransferase [Pontibacterium sinense]
MYYFAYGSNMSLKRLQARVPSAQVVSNATLRQYQLRFHKCGMDRSAKADAHFTGCTEDHLIGVIFSMVSVDKPSLDRAEGEGVGYECIEVELDLGRGVMQTAFAYVALHIDRGLKPYHWYKQHVVQGALEAGLPEDYVALIHNVSSIDDPDVERHLRESSIYQV